MILRGKRPFLLAQGMEGILTAELRAIKEGSPEAFVLLPGILFMAAWQRPCCAER